MNTLNFNQDLSSGTLANKDVLEGFKQQTDKNLVIKPGMSVNEIADIVSDRVMEIIKEQFKATEEKFLAKSKQK
jgi:hypothetical protein